MLSERDIFRLFFLPVIYLLILSSSPVLSIGDFQVVSSEVTVYRDGLVHATHFLKINESDPSISFPLLATSVDNLVAVDGNQTLLDYEVAGVNMTVFSLGVSSVWVDYDSASLTEKEGGVWTLVLNNTYTLRASLAEEASIVYLNGVPETIETVDGRVTLQLPPDDWEISYVLPVVSPALFRVSDLEVDPAEVEAGGEVSVSVSVSNIGEGEGSHTLVLRIDGVFEASETIVLGAGESTTVSFQAARGDPGSYTVEVGGLEGQFTVTRPLPIPVAILYLAAVAGLILGAYTFYARRKGVFSAEEILREHPGLRTEDRGVIRYLEEKGGRAFESEIRERFPEIPRTSLWRLIRRLERMEIVTVEKIGLQNRVELRKT